MTVSFKVNFAAAIATLEALKNDLDGKIEQAANQMLIEGTNVAKTLALKKTGNMRDGIDRASTVVKLRPCIYQITLTSDAPYTNEQEYGPKSGKKIWRFRPFIRPAGAIMIAKSNEIIDRVFNK